MRAERILSRWLEPLTDFMHAKRQRALLDVVGALMKGPATVGDGARSGIARASQVQAIALSVSIDCSAILVCGRSAKKSIGAWLMRSWVEAIASSSWSTGRM